MKFVPPDFKGGRTIVLLATRSEQQGRKSGKRLKFEIFAVKGPITGTVILQVIVSKLRRPLDNIRVSEQEHLCYGFMAFL